MILMEGANIEKIKVKILIIICSFIFLLSSCSNEKSENTQTTISGEQETVVLDGNIEVKQEGVPSDEKEIEKAIQDNMEFLYDVFPEGASIHKKGIYHVRSDNKLIDFRYLQLPIIQEGTLCGSMTLHRREGGEIEVSVSLGGNAEKRINEILQEEDELALVFSKYSEYAISRSNEVYTLNGTEPEKVLEKDRLYETYGTTYNILVIRELFSKENLIAIKSF